MPEAHLFEVVAALRRCFRHRNLALLVAIQARFAVLRGPCAARLACWVGFGGAPVIREALHQLGSASLAADDAR
jgi:hypothetical protein